MISGCTRQNLLISAAHGCGRPQEAKNVDFISIFLHQINKNRLEINNFGGAHGKNLDLRVHTVGAHGRGRLKSIDLAVCTLKSIKIAQINKNERNQQFWCDQMKRPLMSKRKIDYFVCFLALLARLFSLIRNSRGPVQFKAFI